MKKKVLQALEVRAKLTQATQAKLSLILAYFQKRKLKMIVKLWLPAAQKVNSEQATIGVKARFFTYFRDTYLRAQQERESRALVYYRQHLLSLALNKLRVHKDEQQLVQVAMAFRKQIIMEKWRVFVALRKAQLLIAEKKALQLLKRRNLRKTKTVYGKLKANVSLKHQAKMEDHMITIFKKQVKPLILKVAVFASLKLYQKYTRVIDRLDHIRKKRVLRHFYMNQKQMKENRLARSNKLKMASQYRLSKQFNVFKQLLLRKRVISRMAGEHARNSTLLRYMKLLWINTLGLRKISEKRALQFRKRKLQGKVLACLFVSKCQAQLASQINLTVDHICQTKEKVLMRRCFAIL